MKHSILYKLANQVADFYEKASISLGNSSFKSSIHPVCSFHII